MKRIAALFAFAVLSLAGCRESDVRTMTVNVPEMVAEADAQKVKAALAPLGGIDKEKTVYDVAARTVTVRYDSMVIAHKNIEIAIAEAGYAANRIAAIKKAAAK
jgi:copper chaperone CopZ